jgi:hypothetical protein
MHEIDSTQIDRDMACAVHLIRGQLRSKPKPKLDMSTAELPTFFPQVVFPIREPQIDCRSMLTVHDYHKKHCMTSHDFV